MTSDLVKRLYRSKSDIESLSRLRTSIIEGVDTFDYKGVVVNKPWGYEYLLYENPYVAAWILRINENHETSMHCHPTKKSALVVLAGTVACSYLEGWIHRKAGECLMIDEAVFHATKAVSKGGALVMEIECPPNKKDLVRLRDEYGREGEGYESQNSMSRATSDYEYADFHASSAGRIREIMGCRLVLHTGTGEGCIRRLKRDEAQLICMLRGKIYDSDGATLLAPGEVAPWPHLAARRKMRAFGEIACLLIRYPECPSA